MTFTIEVTTDREMKIIDCRVIRIDGGASNIVCNKAEVLEGTGWLIWDNEKDPMTTIGPKMIVLSEIPL